MIVVDASAMVEALVGRNPSPELLDLLEGQVSVPHLLDIEVLSVLRGLVLGGALSDLQADEARKDYDAFTLTRYEAAPLSERIWTLRNRFTAYDASYIALAEGLNAPLVTCDKKLVGPGHHAHVLIFGHT
ncbi:MAG: type II toxin-antitoxin system VapC family toxin [Actinomycetaceae bacterium]|nr:type II toxin-antitoxin system VapC family toxin [Actinomycetaceae bacterium]